MDWFLVRKSFCHLLYPVPTVLVVLGLGVLLLWITPWKRAGRVFVTLGTLVLAGLSWGPVADSMLKPLEQSEGAWVFHEGMREIRWVVVLGSGHVSDPRLPAASRLDEASLARLVEGIRIHRLLSQSRLLLSGGSLYDSVANAQVMAEAALCLGVEPGKLALEKTSRNTEDQAREIKGMLGEEPFVLVTSAAHMPRVMELFRAMGMNPIAAPTNHMLKQRPHGSYSQKYPSCENLRKVRRALHEYLGLAWLKVKKWVQAVPPL